MTGEKGSCVTVRPHSEENEIEDRESGGVFLCKLANKLLLVSVRELFQIIQQTRIKSVNVFRRNGFGKQMFLASSMIGIVMIKGYCTLVGVEDLPRDGGYTTKVEKQSEAVPFVPFYGVVIFETAEKFWKRTAREGYGEFTLLVKRILLCFDNEGFKRLRKSSRGRKGIEDGRIWGLVDT